MLAEAFRGPALDRAVNVKSVSKTVVAALTGAAIDRGVVPGLDATLGDLIPDLIPPGADPRVADLTLADLVTMQAGLGRTSGPNYGAWVSSRDWVGYALAQPFVAEPGERMLYSTGSFHVLGAALARASGETLLALARGWLGRPLGHRDPGLDPRPAGLLPRRQRDGAVAARHARLRRDVPPRRRHPRRRHGPEPRLGREPRSSPRTRSPFSGLDYGYGWFLGRRAGRRVALARGYGGQLIVARPRARPDRRRHLRPDPARPQRGLLRRADGPRRRDGDPGSRGGLSARIVATEKLRETYGKPTRRVSPPGAAACACRATSRSASAARHRGSRPARR